MQCLLLGSKRTFFRTREFHVGGGEGPLEKFARIPTRNPTRKNFLRSNFREGGFSIEGKGRDCGII